jgi:hypothetical protein
MLMHITSLYGRKVNITINGGHVTNGTAPIDDDDRMTVVEKARELAELLERLLDKGAFGPTPTPSTTTHN